jgi:N-carbamoylputrescine amidase
MSLITVALLQMTACGNDQDANRSKGEAFCRRASEMGADIALFPEMWNIGYTSYDPVQPNARQRWEAQAIGLDGAFITHFRTLAQELRMAIAITYLERWEGAPRNSLSLIDRHGDIVMTYAKVHTCDPDVRDSSCTPGDDLHVATLDTDKGSVKVGAMICYDRGFPESARILMLKGAELILVSNACLLEPHRIGMTKARADENMVGIVTANYATPQNNGHSVAFDAVAFTENGCPRDTLIIEAGESEGIYLAQFDMDSIRTYRAREVYGNAFRRPHRYDLLTSLEIQEPFLRTNADGELFDPTAR